MKKNILTFGLIAGLIVSITMSSMALKCYRDNTFEGSMIVGFSIMIIAFSFIFVAIKNFRDKFNEGYVTFKKAFKIGFLISLIAATMYVITWMIVYYNFAPDFMDRLVDHQIGVVKAEKISSKEMTEKIMKIQKNAELYKNPIIVFFWTYCEILPIGLLITLISAAILKRKKPEATNLSYS